MSHTRQDNWCKPTEWWKHLRPWLKRQMAKKERKAAEKRIKKGNDE